MTGTDYHVEIRIRQGRILAAMRELGIRSVAELCRRAGVSRGGVDELVRFQKSPRRSSDGAWRKVVLRVCDVLASEPSDIFPEHLDHEIPSNRIEAMVDRMSIERRIGPMGVPCFEDQHAMADAVTSALGQLDPRSREIVKLRVMDGYTYDEVGRKLGVTREAIRQLEKKALFRMGKRPEIAALNCRRMSADVAH